MAELTDYQRDILVRTVLGEARGEGTAGMAAVAHNIRNRSMSGKFPSDPAKVALQPKQYSVWNEGKGGGRTSFSKNSDLYKKAERIVEGVFGGTIADNTNGALYYHNPSVSPSWAKSVNRYGTTRVGNHIFYNGQDPKEAPVPATMPAALRSRLPETAVAAIEAAAGTPKGPALSYAGMPTALSTAVERVQSTSVPPPRNRPDTPKPSMVADSMANIERANPRGRLASLSAGDSLALAPVLGNGSSPMFDGVYDPRLDAVMKNTPQANWGTGVNRSMTPTSRVPQSIIERSAPRAVAAAPQSITRTPLNFAQGPTGVGIMPTMRAVEQLAAGNNTNAFRDQFGIAQPAPVARTVVSVSDRVRGNPQQTRNVATTVATIPTRSSSPLPAQQSSQMLASRTAASVPAVQQAAERAAAALRPAARLPELAPSTIGQPPTTRTVQTTTVIPRNTNVAQARSEQAVQRAVAPALTRTAAAPVSAPRTNDIGAGTSWAELTGTLGRPATTAVAQPAGSINPNKRQDRLAPGSALPADPNLGNVDYRLAGIAPINSPAAKPTSAPPMPRQRPVAVATQLSVTPPKSSAKPPLEILVEGANIIQPTVPPVPVAPWAPVTANTNIQGLLTAIAGPNAGGLLGSVLGNTPRPAVGSFLGTAANGGRMIQGVNGVMNSITQASQAWKDATGRQDRYTDNGDGSFTSESGGVYYDRHIS